MAKTQRAETMGERLKRLREAKGFTQLQLAGDADVSLGAIRNWEQDRRIPLLDTAARIARVLGVSLDVLAGDVGAEKKRKKRTQPKKAE